MCSSTYPVRVVFRHGTVEEDYKTSEVSLDPTTGKVVGVDAYSQRRVGDHIANFLGPLQSQQARQQGQHPEGDAAHIHGHVNHHSPSVVVR